MSPKVGLGVPQQMESEELFVEEETKGNYGSAERKQTKESWEGAVSDFY